MAQDVDDRDRLRPIDEIAGLELRAQGKVTFKRAGVSRSLDRAEQRRLAEKLDWRNALDRGATTPEQLYTDEGLVASRYVDLLANVSV